MVLILDTATNILGSKERACKLPIMETLAEKMCNLCYERAWYAKLGGCIAIKFLFERMDLRWVFQHQFSFLKALLFVMMDSTGEVSSGAVDMAKSNLEKMLQLCATPLDPDAYQLKEVQDKSLADVIHELVRQVTSPNNFVRDQAMNSLKILADITKTPVTEIMAPHKDVLQDMIPPRYERIKIAKSKTVKMSNFYICNILTDRLLLILGELPFSEPAGPASLAKYLVSCQLFYNLFYQVYLKYFQETFVKASTCQCSDWPHGRQHLLHHAVSPSLYH